MGFFRQECWSGLPLPSRILTRLQVFSPALDSSTSALYTVALPPDLRFQTLLFPPSLKPNRKPPKLPLAPPAFPARLLLPEAPPPVLRSGSGFRSSRAAGVGR